MAKVYIVWAHWYELDRDDEKWIDAIYSVESLAMEHIKRVRKAWENTGGEFRGTYGEMRFEYEKDYVKVFNDFEETMVYYEEKDICDKVKISDIIKEDL